MRLSIFSSRSNAGPDRLARVGRLEVLIILAIVLGTCAAIEMGTRLAFARMSRVEHRIMAEHASATQISSVPSARPILLVGDSLLLLDIDLNLLGRTLPSSVDLKRFTIEQTSYLDWFFGLRRMFSEGLRPATVILCLAPSSFNSRAVRGDYAAYYLYQARDIPAIARAANYDLTKESGLLFAHYSLFYAGRSGIRNFVLNRTFPAYGNLLHDLLTQSSASLTPDEVFRISESRFQEMKRLCAAYGSHFAYVLPPGFGVHEDAILEAASRAAVPILAPVHNDAWPVSKFRDGFHLNEAAAQEFTQMLSPPLYALVASFTR